MKKTFKLTHKKIKLPRLVEAIKHEVKKYIKRERRRELPDLSAYKCGLNEKSTNIQEKGRDESLA